MTPQHVAPSRPVLFRIRPAQPVAFVDIVGEIVHWHRRLSLDPVGGGWHEKELQLGPGAYAYKYRLANGTWTLDPANPRTRACDGLRNSVVVVGGTPDPVLHAPARPFVALLDDGRLLVRAGLRRSAGLRLVIRWDEGHGIKRQEMRRVAAEDEHWLLEATLPASAAGLQYHFELEDGRCVGAAGGGPAGAPGVALRLRRTDLVRRTPQWWRDAVVYTVLIDRFRRGGAAGAWPAGLEALQDRRVAGGDLEGVREALPYLCDLGVSVLHLTPVVPARSAHRYDALDLRSVDPALGGEPALRRLLDTAHDAGLRVLLDLPSTHVHRDFFAFADVRRRGQQSPYWDWFHVLRYPFVEGPGPGYAHYREENWDEPLLNLEHPEVAEHLVASYAHWAALGADGLRIDAAAELPLELAARIAAAVHAQRAESVVFAEVIPDNPWRWTGAGLDAATEFPAQQAVYDWLWRRSTGAARVAEVLARRAFWRGAPGWTGIAFVGTHDQPRLRTLVGDPRVSRLGLLLTLMRAEVPALYSGDEVGQTSGVAGQRFEDVWPDRAPMSWVPGTWDMETLEGVRAAVALRRQRRVLRRGDEELAAVGPDDDVLLLRRRLGDTVVDVLLHGADGSREVSLPEGAASGADVLLRLGDVDDRHLAEGSVRLGPWAGVVLERRLPDETALAWRGLLQANRALAHQTFVEGLLQTPSLPAHLYLTVTERCNLQCAHCLNHSPQRTRSGTARTMQPWLLDRLDEPIAAADYFGFTHGGESLCAPIFWRVLARIQRRRGSRPGSFQAHMATNGMLLDASTCARLVQHGVSSLAVSLDGASAETNDRLRAGGAYALILDNIRALLEQRARRGWDLRAGVSFTVMASNVGELPQLGVLARELGLDWLKVEEIFPGNAAAKREWIAPGDPRVLLGVAELQSALAGSDVVFVDHLEPPAGCPCQATTDPRLAAFRRADDYANRAHFAPCRMAWEQACVDPDGSVHPVDYHHPAAGSLLRRPLPVLWNGATVRAVRRRALGQLPASLRVVCGDGQSVR